MSIISGKTISSAPASLARREKSRTLDKFASGSPSEHEIWATAIFIGSHDVILRAAMQLRWFS